MANQVRLILSLLGLSVSALYFSTVAFGDDQVPECIAYGKPLEINNRQVLHWKRTTKNQFQERGNVEGPIVRIFTQTRRHEHFEIRLGNRAEDVLEVIYNQDFGRLPELRIGMQVQACGDYITATAQSGPYPPSPSGAIIHWLHLNPRNRGHEHGFLVIDGVLYGQDVENAGPRNPHPGRRDQRKKKGKGKRNGLQDWVNTFSPQANVQVWSN